MKKEAVVQTAECRFCHQLIQIETDEKLTDPQAEEKATMLCSCDNAVEYQKKKLRKEKALKNVQALFGEDAPPEKHAGEGIVNLLNLGTQEVYNGELAKITLNLRGGSKGIHLPEQQRRDQCRAH